MERVKLNELNFKNRNEAVAFLKALWGNQKTSCPLCGHELEWLHKKAKKSNCDWQCKNCDKIFKTIHLLDELNAPRQNKIGPRRRWQIDYIALSS